MKKKVKEIFNYKYIGWYLLFISICLAFLIELCFHIPYFFSKQKGDNLENAVTYKVTDTSYEVFVNNINHYVDVLSFKVLNHPSENVSFTSYGIKNNEETFIRNEKIYISSPSTYFIRVAKDVETIHLVFDVKDANILKFDSFMTSNKFSFHFWRFAFIFLIIYFLLDILRSRFTLKTSLVRFFVKVSLAFGILFAFLNPVFYSLDEKEHFVRAYNIADGNFIEANGEAINWSRDVVNYMKDPTGVFIPTTSESYLENWQYLDGFTKNMQLTSVNSTAVTYPFPAYVISGLGIFVGKVFNLSFPWQFYLGRIFNVLFYTIIVAIAIKIGGKYSKIIFLLGLLPALLFQGASYSADMMTNAFALLAVSLTFFYRNRKQKISYLELLCLAGIYVLTFISKMAYFPIVGLIFLIPNTCFNSKKQATIAKVLFPIMGVIVFGLCYLYGEKMGIVQWGGVNISAKEQLLFILGNPLRYVYILFSSLQESLIALVYGATMLLGYSGGLGDINFFLFIIMLLICIASSYKAEKLKLFDKLILFSFVLLSLIAAMSALYLTFTPVGANRVGGFQGRYIVPMILPFALLFCSTKFKLEIKEETVHLLIMLFVLYLNIYSIGMILYKFCF